MGFGFEIFKGKIGAALADSVIDGVAQAVESNAIAQAQAAQAEKEKSDRQDMLKTLIFMVSYNMNLERSGKKAIAGALSRFYDEDISLFSIEDQIDAAYTELAGKNPKDFFNRIAAINDDRAHAILMYTYILYLYTELASENSVTPAHVYNVYLIKKYFAMNRAELAECYKALGALVEQSTDDVAELFEPLTGEEAIRLLKEQNPALIYEGEIKAIPEMDISQQKQTIFETDPNAEKLKEIETLYYEAVHSVGDTNFATRVILPDLQPAVVHMAVATYAKDCAGENAVLLYADDINCEGKSGFLLTNKKFYFYAGTVWEKPKSIPLKTIISMECRAKKQEFVINGMKIIVPYLQKPAPTEALFNLLQKIIPLAMEIE